MPPPAAPRKRSNAPPGGRGGSRKRRLDGETRQGAERGRPRRRRRAACRAPVPRPPAAHGGRKRRLPAPGFQPKARNEGETACARTSGAGRGAHGRSAAGSPRPRRLTGGLPAPTWRRARSKRETARFGPAACASGVGWPRTSNLEPRTSNLEPRTSNLEPRTSNLERARTQRISSQDPYRPASNHRRGVRGGAHPRGDAPRADVTPAGSPPSAGGRAGAGPPLPRAARRREPRESLARASGRRFATAACPRRERLIDWLIPQTPSSKPLKFLHPSTPTSRFAAKRPHPRPACVAAPRGAASLRARAPPVGSARPQRAARAPHGLLDRRFPRRPDRGPVARPPAARAAGAGRPARRA